MSPLIQATGLSKHFSGLRAVSEVSLSCERGMIHAVIGPNGAGKSTLLNLLSGETKPTDGMVFIADQDVTGFSSHQMSLKGVGRSYQRTNIFDNMTVLENCNIAVQSRSRISMRFLGTTSNYPDIELQSKSILKRVGVLSVAHQLVSELSHGAQRQVEIALALATNPDVLLLDEPLAGMGAEESQTIIDLLRDIRPDYAMILVEHDMEAVFALADFLTVMLNGEVIESGLPQKIRASKKVQSAYLGEDAGE
ncbi:MAG: ABC transporter ATP-binding protein [Burkholderiales bacterium]|nr:ABC transporter ATP-binding protein [Burkholderiales bacterium]